MGTRHIIGLASDADAHAAQRIVVDRIAQFEKQGVAVRGIDVTSEGINVIAEANTLYKRARRAIASGTPLELSKGSQEQETQGWSNSIGQQSAEAEATTTEGDTKECPDCAETVKAKAKRCRFCNYIFAEQV